MEYGATQGLGGFKQAIQAFQNQTAPAGSNKIDGVGVELESQAKAIACLAESVDRLGQSLHVVLLPDVPTPAREQGIRQQASEFTDRVRRHTEQISAINSVIDGILQRLNL